MKKLKMTEQEKLEQHRGSRFMRVIPSQHYEDYQSNPANQHQFDKQGRRVK